MTRSFGPNPLTLEAVDFSGNFVEHDRLTITNTGDQRPLHDLLRVSEINFNLDYQPLWKQQQSIPTTMISSFWSWSI